MRGDRTYELPVPKDALAVELHCNLALVRRAVSQFQQAQPLGVVLFFSWLMFEIAERTSTLPLPCI